ncbi:hypothetical protein LTR10_020246 [Elasticomyces elasticus]|uniref:Uncharacterized protein n=1 Tax=Exophiala sideris TaxID=1016849 RepID=A0ABR0JTP0_9EURO|nr:hypothetical protein LTR10_020246 [Elasticomyces elasticus]KAK5040308.1 hypothetical protein LTS07_000806 [Exophiala sideris]KAK5043266.1 hypothetical protein LTR13_001037 [Exophiala sideris]KAK5068686.1 hypothetical protein LTR69_000807 [Exophiala sideris]KAK5186284.1 hypothetical protein LTR44_001340 [Eurotiomycetes sp. CCFEE 6388]
MDLEGSEGSPGLGTVYNGQQNNVAPEDDLPIDQYEPEGDLPQDSTNTIPPEANISAIGYIEVRQIRDSDYLTANQWDYTDRPGVNLHVAI